MHTHICGIRLYASCIRFGNAHTQYAASGCTLLAYNLEMHTHSMRHQVVRLLHTIWKCTHTYAASGCMPSAYDLEMHTHSMRHQVARFLHTIWKCTNTHTVCGIRLHASCIQSGNAQTHTQHAASGCMPFAYDLEMHTHSLRHQVACFMHTIWKCTHTQHAASGCTLLAYNLEMHKHTQYAASGCTLLAYNLEMHKHKQYAASGCVPPAYNLEMHKQCTFGQPQRLNKAPPPV